jgi:hypothetical protein
LVQVRKKTLYKEFEEMKIRGHSQADAGIEREATD